MVTQAKRSERQSRTRNRLFAREMRHAPVNVEELFWSYVRNRQLGGYKFKRQYLVGPYIADFVCLEKRLIVELDGPHHEAQAGYDAGRDAFLREQGFRVMRFTNDETAGDLADVLAIVLQALRAPSP